MASLDTNQGCIQGKEYEDTTWNLDREAEEGQERGPAGLHALAPTGHLTRINADGGGKAIPA